MTDEKIENYLDGLFSDKVWAALDKKQQIINQQLEEVEKKYLLQQEQKRRLIEKAENDFFRRMEEKQRQVDESSGRTLRRIEDNRVKTHIEEEAVPEEDIIQNGRSTGKNARKKRRVLSSVDVVLNPNMIDIKNQLERLESLIREAGFTIVESSGNVIKIDI